ncbi:MAG: FAD-binding protein, partial [Proteobacteria bacterium]|nr:FAD-binding protein [Pseudomonadota bacterium]
MMAAKSRTTRLIGRLPAVRGRYTEDAPLAKLTRFRVGGPAEVRFRPADAEDLAAFLTAKPADVPVTVIGVGSNLLVRDGGVPGVVVRLGREFAAIDADGTEVGAGTAAMGLNVARVAREAGITGLEFLCGIPGTIGGALRMNVGAYGV